MERKSLIKAWNIINATGLEKIPLTNKTFLQVFKEYDPKVRSETIFEVLCCD